MKINRVFPKNENKQGKYAVMIDKPSIIVE